MKLLTKAIIILSSYLLEEYKGLSHFQNISAYMKTFYELALYYVFIDLDLKLNYNKRYIHIHNIVDSL